MDLLARREHSRLELQQKLQKRFAGTRLQASVLAEEATGKGAGEALTRDSDEARARDVNEAAESTTKPEACEIDAGHDAINETIAAVIDKLTEEGLQSDARLAEAYIHARAGRGHGPVKITAELLGKGVDEPLITQALDAADIDWLALARQTAQKKISRGTVSNSKNYDGAAKDEQELLSRLSLREKSKVMRFLQQRGFTLDQVHSVFSSPDDY